MATKIEIFKFGGGADLVFKKVFVFTPHRHFLETAVSGLIFYRGYDFTKIQKI